MSLDAPAQNGDLIRMELTDRAVWPFKFALAPWPFSGDTLVVEAEALPLPPLGRFSSEAEMRSWLASSAGDLQGNAVLGLTPSPPGARRCAAFREAHSCRCHRPLAPFGLLKQQAARPLCTTYISNYVFKSYEQIVDLCCKAWNRLIDQPWRIMSIGMREWTHRF
jgi:putative transposase